MKKFILIFITIDLILLDQLIKWWMIKNHPLLVYENHGVIFGYIQNSLAIYLLLGLGIISLIWLIIYNRKHIFDFLILIPIILVTAGAASNLIDRAYRGYVVDYINLFNLNKFNLALGLELISV